MRLLATLLAIAFATDHALAADLPATSSIDAVTVFPQSAEVRRVVKVKVPQGAHTIVVNDLPQQAQAASIRVEAKATARLDIGSVDSRVLAVSLRDPAVAASTRRAIELEIEKLRDERALIQSDQQAAEASRSFLQNLLQLPTRPQPAHGAPAGEDWSKVLALLGKELAPVNRAILEAGVRMRDVDKRIADAEGRLRAEAPSQVNRTEVRVEVNAREPLDAEIAIRYQVAGASWTPVYDARLATGSKATAPRIAVTRRAIIQQRTGEAWSNVTLALSTTRPMAGTAAPELRPITVDYQPERPVVTAPMPRSAPGVALESAAPAAPVPARAMAKLSDAVVQQAEIEAGAFQAVYTIPGRQSVSQNGEPRRVQIDETDLEAALTVRAVPRVDERAFLYAKLIVPKATPWLAGQVALFRDGTFVGNGALPQLAPGQDHELGFGPDDRVRVRSAVVEDKRADTGIISSTRNETKNFRLTIKNLHERQIAFVIHDQVPVAGNQEIKVEMLARPQPTRRDIDDRRGVVAWEDRLAPDEEKAIEFGWRLSWPAAKAIVYGR